MRIHKPMVALLLAAALLCGGCQPRGEVQSTAATTVATTTTTTTTTTVTTTATTTTATAPSAFHIADVPQIRQFPQYPTGCESASAVMALQFAGESITMDEFIDNHLEISTELYYEDGVRYGPDPWKVFAGNPRSTAAYGCMSPVIQNALNSCLGDEARVVDASGLSMQTLCEQYVSRGIPVIVWVSINMLKVYPTDTWTTPEGTSFTWPGNEHCMLLVGYDEKKYYFNDPYKGREVSFARSRCEERYDALQTQALVVLP